MTAPLDPLLTSEDLAEYLKTGWEMTDIVERLRSGLADLSWQQDLSWAAQATDEIERLQSLLETANAYGAAENKARIEERELLAQMMIRQSLSTGHGDTVGDLVRELEPQIKRMRAEIVTLRNAAVNADERTDMLRGKLATAVLAHIDATAESDLLRVEVAALKKDAERNP